MFNFLSTLTLAQTATGQLVTNALTLMVVGMLVVFSALTLTAIAIIILNHIFKHDQPTTKTTQKTSTPTSDQQRIAVIAAAAATAILGKNVQINNIEPVNTAT